MALLREPRALRGRSQGDGRRGRGRSRVRRHGCLRKYRPLPEVRRLPGAGGRDAARRLHRGGDRQDRGRQLPADLRGLREVSGRPTAPRAVPRHAVRALFLHRQHLGRPRAHALTPGRLLRSAEDAGGIQLDSINVVDRAHYLTVWSRFGPFDRARLDRLVYRRRLFVEYWAHAACLVPVSMLPWWKRAMLDYRVRHTGWSGWLRKNSRLLGTVTEMIRAGGPMGHAELEGKRPARGRGGWWDWRPVQHALHYLWMTGVLTIHSRRHFQKRFDLLERALPGARAVEAVPANAFFRRH